MGGRQSQRSFFFWDPDIPLGPDGRGRRKRRGEELCQRFALELRLTKAPRHLNLETRLFRRFSKLMPSISVSPSWSTLFVRLRRMKKWGPKQFLFITALRFHLCLSIVDWELKTYALWSETSPEWEKNPFTSQMKPFGILLLLKHGYTYFCHLLIQLVQIFEYSGPRFKQTRFLWIFSYLKQVHLSNLIFYKNIALIGDKIFLSRSF